LRYDLDVSPAPAGIGPHQYAGFVAQWRFFGGTSDGRFIAPLGTEVLEFGLLNESIHKIDEHTSTDDLKALSRVYKRIMTGLLTD